MISTILALLFLATQRPPAVECTQQDRYTFEVRRPQNLSTSNPSLVSSLESLPITIATMNYSVKSESTVSHGHLEVCLYGVKEGTFVKAMPGNMPPRFFNLLYPLSGTAVTHGPGAPLLVVCEEKVDCRTTDAQASELFKLFQRERHSNAQLVDKITRVLDELKATKVDSGQFTKLLEFKSRQIQAACDASEMLSDYENTAKEISDRFRRHAVQAIDWNGPDPVDQINGAVGPYNGVFDRIRGKSDSYRLAIADPSLSERFQGLVDEALSIHAQVRALNDLKEVVNACNARQPSCADRPAARKRVREGVALITADIDARLEVFATHRKGFFEDVNRMLYDTTAFAGRSGER